MSQWVFPGQMLPWIITFGRFALPMIHQFSSFISTGYLLFCQLDFDSGTFYDRWRINSQNGYSTVSYPRERIWIMEKNHQSQSCINPCHANRGFIYRPLHRKKRGIWILWIDRNFLKHMVTHQNQKIVKKWTIFSQRYVLIFFIFSRVVLMQYGFKNGSTHMAHEKSRKEKNSTYQNKRSKTNQKLQSVTKK